MGLGHRGPQSSDSVMAEKVADDAIKKAIQADEAELRPDPDAPVKDKLNYWKDKI